MLRIPSPEGPSFGFKKAEHELSCEQVHCQKGKLVSVAKRAEKIQITKSKSKLRQTQLVSQPVSSDSAQRGKAPAVKILLPPLDGPSTRRSGKIQFWPMRGRQNPVAGTPG